MPVAFRIGEAQLAGVDQRCVIEFVLQQQIVAGQHGCGNGQVRHISCRKHDRFFGAGEFGDFIFQVLMGSLVTAN